MNAPHIQFVEQPIGTMNGRANFVICLFVYFIFFSIFFASLCSQVYARTRQTIAAVHYCVYGHTGSTLVEAVAIHKFEMKYTKSKKKKTNEKKNSNKNH